MSKHPSGSYASSRRNELQNDSIQSRRPIRYSWSAVLRYLQKKIKPSHFAEIELLVLTFITGIQDATTFPDYHCFASNQTGNTVLLALTITIPHSTTGLFVAANIGVSLPLFLLGAIATGQIGNHFVDGLSRGWLLAINLIQTGMIFAAAGIQYQDGVSLEGSATLVVVGLLAFASGSQVVISRLLHMTEISTAMATAAWIDLVVDPGLLQQHNQPRTRRALFLLALVAGAFTGAGMYKKMGSAFALLVSAVGKFVVTVMFLFNPSEENGGESIACDVELGHRIDLQNRSDGA
jgi:uncharacterized membrane protein YoaK (UPF0700 family)